MLLMVEKRIRGGICHAIHKYAKANNKYMKNFDKNIESSYLMYLDANTLYGWGMSQNLFVNSFKWEKNVSKFDEDFIKILMKIVIKDIFFKQMLNILKIYSIYIRISASYQKKMKIKKCNNLACNIDEKEIYLVHIRALKQALNHGLILKKVHNNSV